MFPLSNVKRLFIEVHLVNLQLVSGILKGPGRDGKKNNVVKNDLNPIRVQLQAYPTDPTSKRGGDVAWAK